MGLSIFEKTSVIFEIFTNSPVALLFLIFTIILATSLILNLYMKKTYLKFLFPISYFIFILILTVQYHTYLLKGLQLFINDLFFQVYFPSIALYISILFINMIVLIFSMQLKKITNYSKIVNIISFSLLQLLFALFLLIISKNHFDLADWSTLYQNREVLSVLEISMSVFVGWVILLIIGMGLHIINKQTLKSDDGIVISSEKWNQLNYLVKENVFKLSEEVESLKKQLVLEREKTKNDFLQLEQKLEKSNQYFMEQLKHGALGIQNDTLLKNIGQLQKLVEHNQAIVKRQLIEIQSTPTASTQYVQQQIQLLEKMMHRNNQVIASKIATIQEVPMSELSKMQDQVQELEILMKRYMTHMNYQLIQTRKELTTRNES